MSYCLTATKTSAVRSSDNTIIVYTSISDTRSLEVHGSYSDTITRIFYV